MNIREGTAIDDGDTVGSNPVISTLNMVINAIITDDTIRRPRKSKRKQDDVDLLHRLLQSLFKWNSNTVRIEVCSA